MIIHETKSSKRQICTASIAQIADVIKCSPIFHKYTLPTAQLATPSPLTTQPRMKPPPHPHIHTPHSPQQKPPHPDILLHRKNRLVLCLLNIALPIFPSTKPDTRTDSSNHRNNTTTQQPRGPKGLDGRLDRGDVGVHDHRLPVGHVED